jgi:hypothetical protein
MSANRTARFFLIPPLKGEGRSTKRSEDEQGGVIFRSDYAPTRRPAAATLPLRGRDQK